MDIRPRLPSTSGFEASLQENVATGDEASRAAGELSKMSSLTESSTFLIGKTVYDAQTKTPKMPVAELQKQYPGFESVLSQDQHPAMAEMMVERETKRRALEETIAAGPKGFWQGAKEFGAGVRAAMTDPMEATLNIGGLLLTGGLSGLAQLGARAAGRVGLEAAGSALVRGVGKSTIEQAALRTGARVGLGEAGTALALNSAENLVQTGISEGSNALADNAGGRNTTLGEFGQNVAINVVAGFGLDLAMHGAGKALRPVEKVADVSVGEPGRISVRYEQNAPKVATLGGVPDGVTEGILRRSEHQISSGKVVDHTPERVQLTRETFNDGGGQYQFTPWERNDPRPLYAAAEVNVEKAVDAPSVAIGDYLGEDVIQMTDNRFAADSLAARGSTEGPGASFQMEISPDAKLLNLSGSEPFEVEMKAKYDAARAAEDVPAINKLNEELKAQGYDGVHHEGGQFMGEEAPRQNTVAIWNKDKVDQRARYEGDVTKSVQPSSQEIRAQLESDANDFTKRFDYDPEGKAKLDQVEAQPKPKNDLAQAEAHAKEMDDEIKGALERGEITEAEVKAIDEELKLEKLKLKDQETLWKAYTQCKVAR